MESSVVEFEQIVLEGLGVPLSKFTMGGKKANVGKLTITGLAGIELPAGRGLAKGSFIRFEGVAQVEGAGDFDKMDRNAGVAVDTIRRHNAYVSDVRLLGLVESGMLEDSDAVAKLRSAVASLREQGLTDDGIRDVGGLA